MLQSTRAVNEAIALCEQEELRISEEIQKWKEILRSMRRPQGDPPREDVKTIAEGAGAEKEEKEKEEEEVELLERALEKALLVRSTSGATKGPAFVDRQRRDEKGRNQATGRKNTTSQLVHKFPSVSQKDGNRGSRSNAVSVAAVNGKGGARRCTVTGRAAAGTPKMATQTRVTEQGGARQLCNSGNVKRPISAPAAGDRCRRQMDLQRSLVPKDSGTVATTCQLLSKDPVSVAGGKGTAPGDNRHSPKDDGLPSQFLIAWRAQRAKRNRLWDKVLSRTADPVAEKSDFTKRLNSMFPVARPRSSPMDTRTEVEQLARFCRALTHCYQNEVQAVRMGQLPDAGWERNYESLLMLEGLEKLVADLLQKVEQLKKESAAWNRLWPPASCTLQRRWPWGDPSCLPQCPTLTYTSEAELKELEGLRLRVALLEQEVQLHQVFSEALRPCLTSRLSSKDCLSPTVLRSLYSLLGEGGLQFPALVLDTEPD